MDELNAIQEFDEESGEASVGESVGESGDDSATLWVPQWLATAVSLIGELVLLTITIGIIMAMWLPAYLTARPADRQLPEPSHDGPMGGPARLR